MQISTDQGQYLYNVGNKKYGRPTYHDSECVGNNIYNNYLIELLKVPIIPDSNTNLWTSEQITQITSFN